MGGARVLVTGAFGNVGANTIGQLLKLGHEVHAFDVRTPGNEKRQARLVGRFQTHWGDLRDAESVQKVVGDVRPQVVLHIAAVIAPLAFVHPELAEAVNVGGTRLLIEACQRLQEPPRIVLTSSYTVHGPRNPYRDLPPIVGDTPVAPADPYAKHKVRCEQMLASSGLQWTVLRLPAVMPTDPEWGRDPVFLKFFFLLSPDRKEHLLDSRDAGLALANAVEADGIDGLCLALGGPEEDCRVRGIDYHRRGMAAIGLRGMSEKAFRLSHPEHDDSWYGEDWVDTTRSQALLKYQQNTLADHLDFQRRQAGGTYYAMRLFAPLIRMYMHRQSPFLGGTNAPDAEPMWDVTARTFSSN